MSASHAERLERLEAIEAIKLLQARFFRRVDEQEWAGLRALLCDDARFEFAGLGTFADADSAVEGIRSGLTGTTTVHHGHLPEIEVTSATTATSTWPLADVVVREAGSAGRVPNYPEAVRAGHRGLARYVEEHRREDGVWKIAALRLERLRLDPLEPG